MSTKGAKCQSTKVVSYITLVLSYFGTSVLSWNKKK